MRVPAAIGQAANSSPLRRGTKIAPGRWLLAWILGGLVSSALAQAPSAGPGEARASLVSLSLVGPEPVTHYLESVEKWRAGRLQRLTAPTGWLALIGRHPLAHGTWTVGATADNAIRLAAGPARLGTIRYADDGKVHFGLAEGVDGTIDGTTGREADLAYGGEQPTYVRSGTINFYIIQSGGKLFLRVRDSESARRKNFVGIEHFPVDPQWCIEADWVEFEQPRTMRITNVLGIVEDATAPGKAVFVHEGKAYELLPILEDGEERLFFIITDRTAGEETYEASRFFYADRAKDGKIILDFNKVYNPPCAFTPFTTCPLPPKENVLPFRLTAGEKKYRGDSH